MKILYAASNRESAKIQLSRFLQFNKHIIKIAAYKTPGNIKVDWNLESLKDIFNPNIISFSNNKLEIYFNQIKQFNPDLVISDLEPYTSYLSQYLNKPIWQVSPLLIHYATSQKDKMFIGLYKSYPHFSRQSFNNEIIKNIIFNADKKFIYSHLGDTNSFLINDSFEWIRPYHLIGKKSIPCKHDIISCVFHNNKKIINILKKYKDPVLFTNFIYENYKNIILKDMYNEDEYICNLTNSDLFLSEGHTDFLADAYYNKKNIIILPKFKEDECIINSLYLKKFNLGNIIYDENAEIENVNSNFSYNNNIKYLHEHLEDL